MPKRHVLLLLLVLCAVFVPVRSQERADSVVAAWLQQEWGVRLTTNNRLVFFKQGSEKFDDLFRAVRRARRSIHMEYFNFRNDSVSKELFTLLAQKVSEGVEVRVLFDGFGNSSNNRPLRRRHLDSLRLRGVEICEFDPMRFPFINHALHRDHRKIVVIDGRIAYTGGMNVADYYINGKPEFGDWRDVHCRIEGEAVDELQKIFIRFWNKVTQQDVHGTEYYTGGECGDTAFVGLKPDTSASAGRKEVLVVNRVPHESADIMHDTFIRCIDAAQHQIQIVNPYFTLCRHIRRALRRALQRGVDVQIMVSAKSDIPVTPRIVEHTVHRLMKKGAGVWFYEGGFHHSKIMMVDSVCAFVGSANLNSRSLSFDYECNLFVPDRAATRELQGIFEHDKQTRCFMLTPETWKTKFTKRQRFGAWFWQFLTPFV